MAEVLSQDAKLYRNAGTYGTPTWTLINNVRDLTLGLTKEVADVSTRGGAGYREYIDGLKDGTVTFSMVWDTADTSFTAIQTAFLNNTAIEFFILDGVYNVAGSQGLRVTCMVADFARNETLGEALMVDVTVRPRKNANAAPTWVTVT